MELTLKIECLDLPPSAECQLALARIVMDSLNWHVENNEKSMLYHKNVKVDMSIDATQEQALAQPRPEGDKP